MTNITPACKNYSPMECMERYADQMEYCSILELLPMPGPLTSGKDRKRKIAVMDPLNALDSKLHERFYYLKERLRLNGPDFSGIFRFSIAFMHSAHTLLNNPLWVISAIENTVGRVGAISHAADGVIWPRYKFFAFGINAGYEYHYSPNDRFISRHQDGKMPYLRIIQQKGVTEFSPDPVYYKVEKVAKNQIIELNQIFWFSSSIDKTAEDCCNMLRGSASLINRCIAVLRKPLQQLIFEKVYVHLMRDPAMLVASYFPLYSESSTLEDAENEVGIYNPTVWLKRDDA